MIDAKEARRIMLSSKNEEIVVTYSIYKAILNFKNRCQIDFWISNNTANLLREKGYNIIYSDHCTFISW